MRELLDDLERWWHQGKRTALARVVDLRGSGPRRPGATLAVNQDGAVAGSISGGCLESAVVTAGLALFEINAQDGEKDQDGANTGGGAVLSFGYSADDALTAGLTCGGIVEVFICEVRPGEMFVALAEGLRAGRPLALATVIDGPAAGAALLLSGAPGAGSAGAGSAGAGSAGLSIGSLGDLELDRVVARDALGDLAVGTSRIRGYGPCGEAQGEQVLDTDQVHHTEQPRQRVFIESFAPPARMLIFGAADFAAALSRQAKLLGYRVILCDARSVFATPDRFPDADEIVVDWPHRLLERVGAGLTARDAICVLTHEPRFDVPAIGAALRTDVGYLGAMGSRRTHTERLRRLREVGIQDAELVRLRSPIGLDLGALTPEETAVSICAEVIATRRDERKVRPLSEVDGPIHAR